MRLHVKSDTSPRCRICDRQTHYLGTREEDDEKLFWCTFCGRIVGVNDGIECWDAPELAFRDMDKEV